VIGKLDDPLFKYYQVEQGRNAKYFQVVSCRLDRGCGVWAKPTPLTKISTGWVTGRRGKGMIFQFSVFSFQFSVFSFQFSVVSFQLSVVSCQLLVFSVQRRTADLFAALRDDKKGAAR
jgi:hypothetical protein